MNGNHLKQFIGFLFAAGLFLSCNGQATINSVTLPKVGEIDLSRLDPTQFSEEEWYMPYYLKHFSRLANAVVDTGANRGYINISVWRSEPVNRPYDARIMENIVSLAWFYTQKRSWNPYYNDPALKGRLEAALTFWCNMQNSDGMFSEYGYNQWKLAPTAFATKFIGRALYLIADGPQIHEAIYNRAVHALRKALYIGLTNEGLWTHGRDYTNQYANLWGGALMYLNKWPDAEIESLLRKRLTQSISEFQSPCGFFYEKGGPDWGYNLSTHHSDLHVAWEFSKGTDLQEIIINKTARWYDWFSYNAVKEPGKSLYFLNRAIETRQRKGFYTNNEVVDPAYARWTPQSEFVPMARAFELSDTEYQHSNRKTFEKMLVKYPEVEPLVTGEFRAFSPYAFLHQGMKLWHPSDEQKEESINTLPYLKSSNFVHVRHDNRSNTTYSFIRKPGYYAIFNSGSLISQQQRYGLGLVWNPALGTILQSQSATDLASFGTRASGNDNVYEAYDLFPRFMLNHEKWQPREGNQDLGLGDFSVSYDLGILGRKAIRFTSDKLEVSVTHKGKFVEILPLLVSTDDVLTTEKNKITIEKKGLKAVIHFKQDVVVKSSDYTGDIYDKRCKVFEIEAMGKLDYEFLFD